MQFFGSFLYWIIQKSYHIKFDSIGHPFVQICIIHPDGIPKSWNRDHSENELDLMYDSIRKHSHISHITISLKLLTAQTALALYNRCIYYVMYDCVYARCLMCRIIVLQSLICKMQLNWYREWVSEMTTINIHHHSLQLYSKSSWFEAQFILTLRYLTSELISPQKCQLIHK